MKTINRNSGLRITIPPQYSIAELVPQKGAKRRIGRIAGPIPMPKDRTGILKANKTVVSAFENQDMQLMDEVEIIPVDTPAPAKKGKARGGNKAAKTTSIEFAIAPQEDAAILLEQDGVYSWQFSKKSTVTSVRSATRGAPVEKQRMVKFEITLNATQATKHRSSKRDLIGDFVWDKVRAYIFKFAAHIVVGQAMKFLERNVQRGLIDMKSPEDPSEWKMITDPAKLKLPANRSAKILLFIHGTFSSTIGGFGPLTQTKWGRGFLEAAFSNYDAVLGFDHATLGEDPLENATELLNILEGMKWPHPPHFDVITHSRGGLVARSLLEHLLPMGQFRAHFDRVIFVGVPNGGTLFAEPDNWNTLIDLYTNLAVAASKLMGTLPQAKVVSLFLAEAVKSLGALVKYCASTGVDERNVPGLAAMKPDGRFITRLNEEQYNQPTIENSNYYGIFSEFKPRVVGGDHEPREIPPRLLLWIANVFVKQLMKQPSDLVVNLSSMTQIDPQLGQYIKDSCGFGVNPVVYHTNYFLQPAVTKAFTHWLKLTGKAKAVKKKSSSGKALRVLSDVLPQPQNVPHGSMVGSALPVSVDSDILVASAAMPLNVALRAIRKASPSYVVIQRDFEGDTLNYAFASEEILNSVGRTNDASPLVHALRLHETQRSEPLTIAGANRSLMVSGKSGASGRGVVLMDGQPVGVLSGSTKPVTSSRLANLTRMVANPKTDTERILTRRVMPSLLKPESSVVHAKQGETSRKSAARKSKPKATITVETTTTCYFRAEMDQDVDVGRSATVDVLVSREIINQFLDATAKEGKAEVDPSRKIMVQVLPKMNFKTEGGNWIEIDPPRPNTPYSHSFTVKATHIGEGEVWVVARQGQIPLVTLILKPEVIQTRGERRQRLTAEASTAEAPIIDEEIHQLFIYEQRNGKQLTYSFRLEARDLNVIALGTSKPIKGDRMKYVKGLYAKIEKRWLSSQGDMDDFIEELRSIGASMFDELIPENIQDALWKNRKDVENIMVFAEEPFIPWELVHVKPPGKPLPKEVCFMGQMGLVRWLHNIGWPPDQLKIRKGKARYVIPDYPHPDYILPQAAQEAIFLRDKFGATAVPAKSSEVRKLIEKPGNFDLFHFAGHGFADQGDIANAEIMLQGRVKGDIYIPDLFSATTAEQMANLSGKGTLPMVVLNACQVGRAGYKLTGIGGFAQAFLRGGAGAFVGTLWSVDDEPARAFTEEFYRQLLSGKTSVAQAAIKARAKARKAGDASWIAYVVYGNPLAKLKR